MTTHVRQTPKMDVEYVMVYETPPQFDEKRWIAKGKKFPSNSYDFPDLDGYCEQKLSIPKDSYRNIFPDREVTVKDFLALKLPKERYGLVNPLALTCFSTIAANDDNIEHLAARALPSRKFVESMRKEFGQALLDGAVSVEDPSYKNSRLPLWSVQYWHEMYKAVDSQSQWRRCLSWLLFSLPVC